MVILCLADTTLQVAIQCASGVRLSHLRIRNEAAQNGTRKALHVSGSVLATLKIFRSFLEVSAENFDGWVSVRHRVTRWRSALTAGLCLLAVLTTDVLYMGRVGSLVPRTAPGSGLGALHCTGSSRFYRAGA